MIIAHTCGLCNYIASRPNVHCSHEVCTLFTPGLHTVHVQHNNGPRRANSVFQASYHVMLNLAYSATETSYTIEIWHGKSLPII